jgi:hypothetical protein
MLPKDNGELASITCVAAFHCVATVAIDRSYNFIEGGSGMWRTSLASKSANGYRVGCISSRWCYQGLQNRVVSSVVQIDSIRDGRTLKTIRLPSRPLPFKGGKGYYVFGVDDLACSTSGRCVAIVAVQLAVRGNAPHLDLMAVEVDGRWSGLRQLPGILGRYDNVFVSGLGCAPQGSCVAAGTFMKAHGLSETFFASV